MLATPGTTVPTDPGWSHEVKWDGVRVLADTTKDGTRLFSRNENVVTVAWPEINRSPLGDRDLLVDGEVIALNERGLPDFRVLQDRMHVRKAARPRAASPSGCRRRTWSSTSSGSTAATSPACRSASAAGCCAGLGLEHSTWQVPEAYDDGPMLFDATLQQGLEGIVSKRLTSRYTPAERTRHWLKFAHRHRLSYVVGGWRPQEGTSDRLAALLVGEPTADGLIYRGRVGSGIGGQASRALTDLLAPLGRAGQPVRRRGAPGRRDRHVLGRARGRGRRRHARRRLRAAAAAVVPRRPHRPEAGGPVIGRARSRRSCRRAAVPRSAAAATGESSARSAPRRSRRTVVLDGVRVRLPNGTTQVVTVNRTARPPRPGQLLGAQPRRAGCCGSR